MEKQILIISECTKRSGSEGLTTQLVSLLNRIKEPICNVSVFNRFLARGNHVSDYPNNDYYYIPTSLFLLYLLRIPMFGNWLRIQLVSYRLKRVFKNHKFDLMIIYQIPNYSHKLVRIAHAFECKVMLRPWGSDVLRASRKEQNSIRKAYHEAEYIGGDPDSNVIKNARQLYSVPENKIVNLLSSFKSVNRIFELKGLYSREQMSQDLSIPLNRKNIICGYNLGEGQRHKLIIEQINSIKQYLPSDYQLIFPITYGWNKDSLQYKESLKLLCRQYGLNAVFLEKFLTTDQMVYLHLITDLFITIQPTDSGNAFLIEALMSGNQIITGKWLSYTQFERFGSPFYLCEKPEDLGKVLKDYFTNAVPPVYPSKSLIEDFIERTKVSPEERWSTFLATI